MINEKNGKIIRLISLIEKDLKDRERLKTEIDELDIYTTNSRILGSILHDFYTGVEKIFSRIANEMESGISKSPTWHKDLLDDMTLDLKEIRPAVINGELGNSLEEYLRFRHIFRGSYGFMLDSSRLEVLFHDFDDVYTSFIASIKTFLLFLKSLI